MVSRKSLLLITSLLSALVWISLFGQIYAYLSLPVVFALTFFTTAQYMGFRTRLPLNSSGLIGGTVGAIVAGNLNFFPLQSPRYLTNAEYNLMYSQAAMNLITFTVLGAILGTAVAAIAFEVFRERPE